MKENFARYNGQASSRSSTVSTPNAPASFFIPEGTRECGECSGCGTTTEKKGGPGSYGAPVLLLLPLGVCVMDQESSMAARDEFVTGL